MKRNKFKRALHHLNKKHVVESAPTNNTLGVFSVSPSGVGPVGWTDREFDTDASGNPIMTGVVANFSVGENPQSFDEARDTSGLFEDDGTIKTLTPPGDNSYILGPFASMWYAWGNFTTLGYIRQSDRKMVNLGAIIGKLSDWDETTFNSYGQLTLEQAIWFKNVKKFGGIDNDPANHNYRAFYPGPPSNTPDAYGRYLCSIADSKSARGTETRPAPPVNPTQPGEMNADDNFSKQADKKDPYGEIKPPKENMSEKEMDEYLDSLPDSVRDDLMNGRALPDYTLDGLLFSLLPQTRVLSTAINKMNMAFRAFDRWWNKGRNSRVPNESTANWRDLMADDIAQRGKPGDGTRGGWDPTRGFRPGVGADVGGFGSGPTPAVRQAFERLIKPFLPKTTPTNDNNQNNQSNQSNQSELPASFNEPETGTFEITSADIPDEFKTNNEDKPSAKGVTMTKWMSRTEFMKKYPDSSMTEYLSSLPYGATNFMKPDPNFPGARIVDTAAYERYFMTGDTSGVSGKPKHSKATPEPEQKKWGGKTKDEIIAELDATSEKLTAEEQAAYQEMRTIALELGADFASLIGGLFTGGTTAAPVLSKIGVKLLKKYGKTVAGKMIRKLLKKFRNKKNDKIIDDIADAAERGGNDPERPTRKPFEKDMGDSYQNLSKSGEAKFDTATERLMNQRRLGGKDGELAGRLLDDLNKAAEISDAALNKVLGKIKKSPIGYLFNSYEFNGRVLSESRKKHILREIKKPTTLPDAKKKFKVKPKVLGHPSNKTLSDQMKDTTPNVAFKKEIPVWSMNQKMRNARTSQEKKNEVLEYLGSSGDHWEYMTKTIKEHNKKIINLNYGGKKKKVTRKEQVDKDTLVFMEDDLGNKSSALQSKINETQAEAGDKEMFAKYYEINPQKKRSLFKEVVKRGVFDYPKKPSKKGYPDKEPAKLDPKTGMHPEYGKKYKHDKLDPQSAESMPMQGDPEIDANIAKNLNPESKKRKTKVLNQPNG